MMIRVSSACWIVVLLLTVSRTVPGQPPPRGSAATAPRSEPAPPSNAASDEPVVGQLEYDGWGLVGRGGRHYVFGGLAVSDYSRGGRHYIVTLQQEEPSLLPKPDENYLYYRELGSGLRWAIGRRPQADETYLVFLQQEPEPAGSADVPVAKPKWTLFHRARLTWPEQEAESTASNSPNPQAAHKTKERCPGAP